MESETKTSIGYLKYSGSSVEEGIIDARSAGEALLSFNDSLNHLISVRYPFLSDIDVQTPILIRKGSWEALIPDIIETWIKVGAGLAYTTYLTTASKKLAENGFKDKTISSIFKDGLSALMWLVKLAKHLGSSTKQKLENLRWRNHGEEVGIPNEAGEFLWVPVWVINAYELTPESLFIGMINAVDDEKILAIGVQSNDGYDEVVVDKEDKLFFISDKEEIETLFSELEHDKTVQLEGYVTRGTETSNSIGFRYKDHILTCHPRDGNIKRFKKCLFLRSKIYGTISRADKFGGTKDPRPKIIFDDLKEWGQPTDQLPLEGNNKVEANE